MNNDRFMRGGAFTRPTGKKEERQPAVEPWADRDWNTLKVILGAILLAVWIGLAYYFGGKHEREEMLQMLSPDMSAGEIVRKRMLLLQVAWVDQAPEWRAGYVKGWMDGRLMQGYLDGALDKESAGMVEMYFMSQGWEVKGGQYGTRVDGDGKDGAGNSDREDPIGQ